MVKYASHHICMHKCTRPTSIHTHQAPHKFIWVRRQVSDREFLKEFSFKISEANVIAIIIIVFTRRKIGNGRFNTMCERFVSSTATTSNVPGPHMFFPFDSSVCEGERGRRQSIKWMEERPTHQNCRVLMFTIIHFNSITDLFGIKMPNHWRKIFVVLSTADGVSPANKTKLNPLEHICWGPMYGRHTHNLPMNGKLKDYFVSYNLHLTKCTHTRTDKGMRVFLIILLTWRVEWVLVKYWRICFEMD